MVRMGIALVVFWVVAAGVHGQEAKAPPLWVGFGEADITPRVDGKKNVYMAGFGQNRVAEGVHDPLLARVVVLKDGKSKIALVSVDLVGLFYESVQRVRKELAGFDYVLVSSTHNHEGPDTMGLWGPNPFLSGVDPAYLERVEKEIVRAVRDADRNRQECRAEIGTGKAPELLHDGREPQLKHDDIAALRFVDGKTGKVVGVVVQWNCHPETLDSRNKQISADFVWATVEYLEKKFDCPVVYFTGAVGGLMTSLHVPVKDEQGQLLKDGTFEKTERYGKLVGQAAEKALGKAQAVALTPIKVGTRQIYLPIDNKLYILGWQLGVLKRKAFAWKGNVKEAEPVADPGKTKDRLCLQTELVVLKLGSVAVAGIPGEIYPELVLDKVQDPVDAGADFPDAAIEPAIYKQLTGSHRLLIGLANDEIGYILPKRQWDQKAPFCYGRNRPQYGEVNSLGPETGPLLCEAFRELCAGIEK
jgi:hypothetical protein